MWFLSKRISFIWSIWVENDKGSSFLDENWGVIIRGGEMDIN